MPAGANPITRMAPAGHTDCRHCPIPRPTDVLGPAEGPVSKPMARARCPASPRLCARASRVVATGASTAPGADRERASAERSQQIGAGGANGERVLVAGFADTSVGNYLPSATAQSAPNVLARGALEARRGLERTGEWPYRYVKTRSSWIREVMLSLVKTLLRWYLAVRADVEAVAALDRATWRRRRAARHASGSYTPCRYMSSFVDREE